MSGAVFDASALLAMAFAEVGAERAKTYLSGGRVSAVNYSEAAAKLIDRGLSAEGAFFLLDRLGLTVVPFDAESASAAARLRIQSRSLGLSFADRACLALAIKENARAVTADKVWSRLDLACDIVLIR